MRHVVLDTNVLLMILPKKSPYHCIWTDFLQNRLILCVSNEMLNEYSEIISQKTTPLLADKVIMEILYRKNVRLIIPSFRFELIKADPDDNKFVDCAITANADYLVSNDHHFKILKTIPHPKVNLVTLGEYILTR